MENVTLLQRIQTRILGLLNWQPGKLARDTVVTTVGFGLRTVAQAIVFLIVTRTLGIAGYGGFVAVLALAGILSNFVGLGVPVLLVRDLSRQQMEFSLAWGRTLAAVLLSAPLFFGLFLLLTWLLISPNVSVGAIILIGVSDLVLAPITMSVVAAYRGVERMARATRLILIPIVFRFVMAVVFLGIAQYVQGDQLLFVWAGLYCLAAFVAAGYALYLVSRDLGLPQWPNWFFLPSGIREGVIFSLSGSAFRLYVDIDKTMLARMTTLEITGAYSAAYRLVELVTLPVNALLSCAQPRFFRQGLAGVENIFAYAMRMLPVPLAYVVGASSLIYVFAGGLPLLLGEGYVSAVEPLRWLAWLPVLVLFRAIIQIALVGCDRQRYVMWIMIVGAGVNFILNLWLIPEWTWKGAVFSSYFSELVMIVGMAAGGRRV